MQNPRMPTPEEKSAFAERLKTLLREREPRALGSTHLSIRFNTMFDGPGVTPQTAHKWLNGRSIPKPEKLRVLSDWLGVDWRWLHYGPTADPMCAMSLRQDGVKYNLSPEASRLAYRIESLPVRQRALLEELVSELYGRHELERARIPFICDKPGS
jgi:transcriptional regulator with XRE-family HTH domain